MVERQNSLAFLAPARRGQTVLPFSCVVGFDLLTFYLEFSIYVPEGCYLVAFFSYVVFMWCEGGAYLTEELRGISSCSVFWESLCGIGIISFLNV